MCLPCARTRGEGAPLLGLHVPIGSCATFACKKSQGQRVKDAPLPIPMHLLFVCCPAPKLGDKGGKAPLPGWRAAAGHVATSARCGGCKRGGALLLGLPLPHSCHCCVQGRIGAPIPILKWAPNLPFACKWGHGAAHPSCVCSLSPPPCPGCTPPWPCTSQPSPFAWPPISA